MYDNFQKIDGTHPWRDVSPEGYEDYPVRYRSGGRVLYFNFALAREMGLIAYNHPFKMNPQLEEVILKTFSLQILNEYDWMNKKRLPKDGYEDRLYMATRYLQVQHKNKQGKTSGDGRSIWNGYLENSSLVYDLSSRGTGVTILSPGAQEADGPIPTGDPQYGYSTGLADIDEMLGSAIMSEIFYRSGLPTERTLVVIDYKDKTGVGVRTSPNLIRPAHFFRYLKMGMHAELKASFDYFLERQEKNKMWTLPASGKARYTAALELLTDGYAKLVAILEEEYIFNWLAWDGDNILAHGAILDYGSIRQFAAKHNKYRYEDVDRFSTCLTEQKKEARNIVQTFIQLVDYITTGEKKNLQEFQKYKLLSTFDTSFEEHRKRRMLYRIGFTEEQTTLLIQEHLPKVDAFQNHLNYFEHVKVSDGQMKVPDGIDHPPVFLVRRILRQLPQFLLDHKEEGECPVMPAEMFCKIMAGSYVNEKDLGVTPTRQERALEFQRLYQDLVGAVSRKRWMTLESLAKRAAVINYEYRGTGDGLTWVVNAALAMKDQMDLQQFQDVIDRFIESQVLVPDRWRPIKDEEIKGPSKKACLLREMQNALKSFNELI